MKNKTYLLVLMLMMSSVAVAQTPSGPAVNRSMAVMADARALLGANFNLEYDIKVDKQVVLIVPLSIYLPSPSMGLGPNLYTVLAIKPSETFMALVGIGAQFFLTGPAFASGMYVKPLIKGGYAWPNGIVLSPAVKVGYQWVFNSGLTLALGGGAKYIHLFNVGESRLVEIEGQIKKMPLVEGGFFPTIDVGLGYSW